MRLLAVLIVLVFVVAVFVVIYGSARAIAPKRRARALRTARWRPATRDLDDGRTAIVIEKVATHDGHEQILAVQHVDTLPADSVSEGVWESVFVQMWARAESRAVIRNAETDQ
jgi:hypothetical protein